MLNTIVNTDCISGLKSLPDKSINTIITSPPYYQLRDYGGYELIWDDPVVDCEHDFEGGWCDKCGYSVEELTEEGLCAHSFNDQNFCKSCSAWKGELGQELTKELYIQHLCDIFEEAKRVLKDDGSCWVNLGDCYAGSGKGAGGDGSAKETFTFKKRPNVIETVPRKSLNMIPSRFAIAMTDKGWVLRNHIVWEKPNAVPESVKDRMTSSWESFFFFTKNPKYYFKQQTEPNQSKYTESWGDYKSNLFPDQKKEDFDKYRTQGRNKRDVWKIHTKPFKGAHTAVFPQGLIETPIRSTCPEKGTVLDIFMGAGTVGAVAKQLNRNYIGFEINPDYISLADTRIKNVFGELF